MLGERQVYPSVAGWEKACVVEREEVHERQGKKCEAGRAKARMLSS